MASSRSIRFKLSVLLVTPLASLVALWGFGAVVTVGDSVGLLDAGTLQETVAEPADDLVLALQREHLLSTEYMVTRSPADRGGLDAQRMITDQARARLRAESAVDAAQSIMSPRTKAHYDELMLRAGRIDELRVRIDQGRIGFIALSREFGLVPDAVRRFGNSLGSGDDPEVYQQARALAAIDQAKDFLSRERALGTGALALERPLSSGELILFTQLSAKRVFLLEQGLAELGPELRGSVAEVASSPLHDRFSAMEKRLLDGATVSGVDWRSVTDQLDAAFQIAVTRSSAALADKAGPAVTATYVRAGVAGALGLVAVIVSLVVSYRVGRGLTRELAGLRRAAVELAEVRLPDVMERLRRGERVDAVAEAPPLEAPGSTSEVHAVAAAFDSVQHRALDAAVEQARLREGVAHAFRNLARRKQGLLQRQLKLLDGMQRQAEDAETLEKLFTLDHLTTRMRRHAEGLVILSGGAAGRRWRSAVPMEDVLRGAAAQVEDYARVRIYPMPGGTLPGDAVADMMHLFAEIIENATVFSPPGGEVSIRGALVPRGFAVEIEDRGLGLTKERRDAINARLASPPEFDPAETDRLGFAVVGLLAARYGVDVTLRPSPYGGTAVTVLIPANLLGAPEPDPGPSEPATAAHPASQASSAHQVSSATPTASGTDRVRLVGAAETAEAAETAAPAGYGEPAGLAGIPASAGAGESGPLGPAGEAVRVPAARAHPVMDARRTPQRRSGGLPRRVRQANLTPQLRQETEAVPEAETRVAEVEERSPEEARALLNSLQAGWRRGRSESEHNGGEGA
ncbi:nitrate- and nitrite sensing domain-containing protein [Planomonospora sp. ID91781]|uniref:sensor histidine kinase n=1 Tax=Planomonospora sp. ID91781 TaxID=2738135 RepID=UPI0018C3FCF1|nr:nitrate- and nitrite sensing domain-containing protein [Planomonospora sp. ID91781]MBG0820164.1 nitrate- and nitrite sensing domain-containing protein [Planomonospora sp. ID91781]